mgnify:CR=1 FL=1
MIKVNKQRLVRVLATSVAGLSIFINCAAAATVGVGTVTGNGLRLRSQPDTSSEVLSSASKNTKVVVLDPAGDNWYKVNYDSHVGYMCGDYVSVAPVADMNIGSGIVDVDGSTLRLRSGPSTNDAVLCSIPDNGVLQITGVNNGWYKVTYNGQAGYVSSNYVCLPAVDSAFVNRTDAEINSLSGSKIMSYAKQFLGTPYVYGGSSPSGFDCSGFTQYVYKHFGYGINRTASTQLQNGVSVSKSNLQPGDLVFFRSDGSSYAATHVGLYIGNNQFIHFPSPGKTVTISNLNSAWYSSVFVAARRIV